MSDTVTIRVSDLYNLLMEAHDKALATYAEFVSGKLSANKFFDDDSKAQMKEFMDGHSFEEIMEVASNAWQIALLRSVRDTDGLKKHIESKGPDYFKDIQKAIDNFAESSSTDGELLH